MNSTKRHAFMRHVVTGVLTSVLLIGALPALSSCSIPTDDRAHEIPPEVVGSALQNPASSTTSTEAPAGSRRETLYLVRTGDPASSGSGSLSGVVVDIPGTSNIEDTPRVVIERLISLSPADLGQAGLVNALPKGTRVISAKVDDDDILDLNLSGLADIESALQQLAFAQIVFTVTGLTNSQVDGIRFSVDGTLASVPVEEGTKAAGEVVSRNDFPKLRDQVESINPITSSD